jgi:hypothetical protein
VCGKRTLYELAAAFEGTQIWIKKTCGQQS